MNFLETIWKRLESRAGQPILQEIHERNISSATGEQLLVLIQSARGFVARAGLQKGDRCALLAPNSIRWAAVDLALMAEGILVVPLYARQAPQELAAILKDCAPALVCCGDAALRDSVASHWPGAPRLCLFDEIFAVPGADGRSGPRQILESQPVTIIYTSGTSGEPKGVVLTAGNVSFMLGCTNARLDLLMGSRREPDRVFHYMPFCFAASWILLLTCLSRNAVLSLCTNLVKLADEMKLVAPQYCVNVPTVLERMRARIEDYMAKWGGIANWLYQNGKAAWFRRHSGTRRSLDAMWLSLATAWIFPRIRAALGPNLQALICGSAPLALDTQLFFATLGIRVLQVYGLTETTAICTMDDPHHVEPGYVGPAIPGIEMRLGEDQEILVRGPNLFPGYWNRPEDTAQVMRDGWFHSGDQGEVNSSGNWRIVGRLKNLIILNSGHNVAPEPIEDSLVRSLSPGQQATQVMLVGNNCSYLAALVAGAAAPAQIQAAIDAVNAGLPHYKQVRAFAVLPELFSAENGLLTANGKLRRDAIASRYGSQIEGLYRQQPQR